MDQSSLYFSLDEVSFQRLKQFSSKMVYRDILNQIKYPHCSNRFAFHCCHDISDSYSVANVDHGRSVNGSRYYFWKGFGELSRALADLGAPNASPKVIVFFKPLGSISFQKVLLTFNLSLRSVTSSEPDIVCVCCCWCDSFLDFRSISFSTSSAQLNGSSGSLSLCFGLVAVFFQSFPEWV